MKKLVFILVLFLLIPSVQAQVYQEQVEQDFTIAGATEVPAGATLQTLVFDIRNLKANGILWLKVETTTATAGLADIDIEFRAAVIEYNTTWAESQMSQEMIAEAVDMSVVSVPKLYNISRYFSDNGSVSKVIGPEGNYVYLTGQALDAGVIKVTLLVR